MKHEILSKEKIQNPYWAVLIKLVPENEGESQLVNKVQLYEATEEEIDLVDAYLGKFLKSHNHTVVASLDLERFSKNVFFLKTTLL